jgi:hypothetical protein
MYNKNIFCVAVACALSIQAASQTLPPLPRGVTELKFSEFFVMPVGPAGLTFTDKLLSLDGKRVRMTGYMVEQDKGGPGTFLFCALPVQLHDHDAALADDLPPAVVHVTVPTCRDRQVPHARGLMLLTGTLSIGPRNEPDGRVSLVHLALDPPEAFKAKRRTPPAPESFHRLASTKPTHK